MAFEIRPNFQRLVTISFTKEDGSAGAVQGAPTWELSDPALGSLADVAADGMSANVQHNGGVGDVMLTVRADGDLGEGVHPIVASETFSMLAPLGATGAAFGIGEEVPIPTNP